MKFSIIIPTYNRGELLKDTIKSVINQTYSNWELIVVDDGGNDLTETIINSFDDIRINYFWKENEERGIARNYGLNKSTGDYIFYLDSDDILLPQFLEKVNSKINQNGIKWAFVEYDFYDGNNTIKKPKTKPHRIDLTKQNYFGSALVLQKNLAKKNRYLEDPDFTIAEDWYVVLKLLQKETPYIIEEPLRLVRVHEDQSMEYPCINKLDYCRATLLENIAHFNLNPKSMWNIDKEMEYLILLSHTKYSSKKTSIKYLSNYLLKYKSFIFSRRYFVIIKKIIFD